jgi:hypothetical protein
MYFNELKKFCSDNNITVEDIPDLNVVKNSIVLTNGHWLTKGVIPDLKNNGNTIVSFDINDHSSFISTIPDDEIMAIDLIFKVAGIQKPVNSFEMMIDDNLNYTRERQPFIGGNHAKYFEVINSGKVRALPHIPWGPTATEKVGFHDRKKLVVVRGGHHYQRVHLLLNLLSKRLADQSSMFVGSMYVHQYCDGCKQAFKSHGRIKYSNLTDTPCRLKYWTSGFSGNGSWNNQCIPRYLDLAKLFNEKHGGLDFDMIEKVFDGMFVPNWLHSILSRYVFYADIKWIYSIYAPPRFWEAAGARTINLVPERMNDQDHFPPMQVNEHYLTYREDFSDLQEVIEGLNQEWFELITESCFDLYDKWIRPGRYRASERLFRHIVEEINAKAH